MSFEYGVFAMSPAVSITEIRDTPPSFNADRENSGPFKDAERLLQPFNAIGAASEDVQDVSYPEIEVPSGTGE